MTTPVLIVGWADGYIEAFAPKDVTVRTVLVPDVSPGPAEILAQTYALESLPARYAALWQPGMMRANENIRRVTVEELVRRQLDRQILDTLNKLARPTKEQIITCLV